MIRSRKPRLLLDPASVLNVRQLISDLRQAGMTRPRVLETPMTDSMRAAMASATCS